MKKVSLLFVVAAGLCWASCGSNAEQKNNAAQESTAHDGLDHEGHDHADHEGHDHSDGAAHDHDHANETIALNNGEKWKVNSEMIPFINNGIKLVNNYVEKKDVNFGELAKQLEVENGKLIESCTMKGASHDELHKWLHPHLELVEELAESKDAKAAEGVVAKLKQSYETYTKYFQ